MLFQLAYCVLNLSVLARTLSLTPLSGKPGFIDNGTFGQPIEVVHLFHGDAPIGVTVSASGRVFVSYNRGVLSESPMTVGELVSATDEVPFPSHEFNTPPMGLSHMSGGMLVASNDSRHFINVQSVIVDAKERLWALDSGRPVINGTQLLAVEGGPKLVGFDLKSNATTPFSTITFPESTLPADGYLNDVRFDLRPELTQSGQGIAYISDSGSYGIIVVDLGTGKSWRHLSQHHSTVPQSGHLPSFFGIPTYRMLSCYSHDKTGSDGIALSPDGAFLYLTPLAGRSLFRVDTAVLRVNPADDMFAAMRAENSIQYLGETGGQPDGLESDTSGNIYLTNQEQGAINIYDPKMGAVLPFLRSPMMAWPDTLSVADDGYIYATLNQLWLSPIFQNGTDKRVKPFGLVRSKSNGGKIKLI
ncbi:major royal jelly protein-domain-containing protein [Cyathus striatus]|nr:major royal jelly protein-domain-containing protein [Cyathus striatus]